MAEQKVIEKAGSEEEKKKRKLLIMKIIPVAVLAFILIAVSLAWFTIDKALDLDSFGMKSVDSPFELKTVGSAEELQANILDSNDYSKVSDDSNITSDENNKIYWLLDDESGMKKGINPGSHGKLTFYVVPKQSGELEIQFKLGITGYDGNDADGYKAVEDSEVTKFLNGHILFFRKYENGLYSEPLEDEQFSVKFTGLEKDVEKEIDIYWVWPNTMGQYLLNNSDIGVDGGQLFDADLRATYAKKIADNYDSYFDTKNNSGLLDGNGLKASYVKALNDMAAGSTYSTDDLSALSMAYNDADEKIGTEVKYLLLELGAGAK